MDLEGVGVVDAVVPTVLDGSTTYATTVRTALAERRSALDDGLRQLAGRCDALSAIACALVESLHAGGKVLVAGNGGSAAEAQHFAAELVGRFKCERRPYAALALTVDSSVLTAVGNDYGFADVFARQVLAVGQPSDLLLAYSTSGNSENLLRAAVAARRCGMTVAAVTGDLPNPLERLADRALRVPSTDTPVIQELQMVTTHVLCEIAERELMRFEREVDA
jgi:D-sedoheptulose 7-phosphate isomerase